MFWICSAAASLVGLYIATYLLYYGKYPKVYCKKNTKLQKLIEKHLKRVKSRYWPLLWCYESRAITLVRYFAFPFFWKIKYEKEIHTSEDGGHFTIDWAGNYNNKSVNQTIIALVPGITSHRRKSDVYSNILHLIEAGYIVAYINHRGDDGMELKTARAYCATHTADLHATVDIIKEKYKDATIIGVGVSMGAMIIAKYLEETGDECDLKAAVLFSCPFHPLVNCKRLEETINYHLLNRPVLRRLKINYMRYRKLFKDKVDHDAVMKATGVKEFDDAFTAPVFGYNSSDHYYEQCRVGKERLKAIRRPTLCVNADDDVFSEEATLPKTDIVETEHVAMVMTRGGGHRSHMQGINPFGSSFFEEILLQYIDAFVNTTHLD